MNIDGMREKVPKYRRHEVTLEAIENFANLEVFDLVYSLEFKFTKGSHFRILAITRIAIFCNITCLCDLDLYVNAQIILQYVIGVEEGLIQIQLA